MMRDKTMSYYALAVAAYILLNVGDTAGTYLIVGREYDLEINPVARWALETGGYTLLGVLKVMTLPLFLLLLEKAWAVTFILSVYLMLCIGHVVALWSGI